MTMLNYVNTFLTFYILGIFVSDYPIEGATINERNQACSLREWGCKNGGCIAFEKRCDGEVNCSDGSDEATELCSADNFGLVEAGPWSDLLSRSKRQSRGCRTGQFRCDNRQCIDEEEVCDGQEDCDDGSDETLAACRSNRHVVAGSRSHRSKRQSRRCRTGQFQCHNGQCIDEDGMCDGQVDCGDGSDETLATCRRNTCPKYLFRCSYGACVDGDAKCNGISQCADNSDEQSTDCGQARGNRGTCTTDEWACVDGSCLDASQLCDGVKDCPDGSDETIQQCKQLVCNKYLFRCSYGACVDSGSNCNGIVDCADGSDESPELCNRQGSGSRPTQILTSSTHHGVHCKPLRSASVNFKCYRQHSNLEISCHAPQDPNSYAKASCKDSFQLTPPPKDLICGIDGSWDYMPTCTPVCGILAPQGQQLVINGKDAKIGEFPWHVGLYEQISNSKLQICGGSIFSPKLVVSAAHCVYTENVGVKRASTFTVAAGKIYRRWNAPREDERYVQKRNVFKIEIPERYKGISSSFSSDIAVLILEKGFEFSSLVRPVCIGFDYKDNLDGQVGKVAGWGLTSEDGNPSPILQTAYMPFVSYQDCYSKSKDRFRPLITPDKICAGNKTGTALCKGDSGGGLVFSRSHGYQDLHYLYGIVSTSELNEALTSCSAFAYTAFTNIIMHREWFEDIWSRHLL